MLLSKHFTLQDLTVSKIVSRLSPDIQKKQQNPPLSIVDNLRMLAVNVLDPLYEYAVTRGYTVVINSAYRCEEVNNYVGGSKTSDHLYGRAADIEFYHRITGKEANGHVYLDVVKYVADNLKFYQMIWEYGDRSKPAWLHIAYRQDNKKRQILRIGNDTNRTYVAVTVKDLESYVA